jgi:trimethylamine---corrinoid protein Co-methyltransferase
MSRSTEGRRRSPRGERLGRSRDAHRQLRNPFGGARVLSDDEVEHIHEEAVRFLARHGVKVLLPDARRRFAEAGAEVDDATQMVRIPTDLTTAYLAHAPAEFTIHARNPERSVHVGGDSMMLLPVAGPPYASDRVRGRRAGTLADFDDFVRLTQHADVLHGTTPAVEAQDVPMHERHLRTMRSALVMSDKVPFFYARGHGQVADAFAMVRLAHGIDEDAFTRRAYCWTNINTNSPRQLDIPMSMGIIDAALAAQPAIITPFTLAGAMAPVSLAGALLLQHVEALAGITLGQITRLGTPMIYGAFTSNVDMRSGSPAFGTPETIKAAIASGQLARHLGVPWRSQAASTSNTEDAQGATETLASMNGCILGGANMVLHAAGWQEGGLTASFEKFVLDVEMLEIVAESMQPLVVDDAELALDSLGEIQPGGHFFGTTHTLDRFETAFHEPTVFSRANLGQWIDAGRPDSAERATVVARQWIDAHVDPPFADDRRAELDDFVARRLAEGGALPES